MDLDQAIKDIESIYNEYVVSRQAQQAMFVKLSEVNAHLHEIRSAIMADMCDDCRAKHEIWRRTPKVMMNE